MISFLIFIPLFGLIQAPIGCSSASAAETIEVAITVDDLPSSGVVAEGSSRIKIAQKMIDALKDAGISGVYGFANGKGVKESQEYKDVLKLWKQSGHRIGNHTFGHSDLGKETAEEFIKDIQENENIYKRIISDKEFKVFRFPFLQEGDTHEKRQKVRNYLFKNHYKIAEVSLDFEDWAWNLPYARCTKKKDIKSLSWLKESYLQHALRRLDFVKDISQRLYHRGIKYILLIHIGDVDAAFLKDLIKAYKAIGVKFISLDAAMKDPVYSIDPNFVAPVGKIYLLQHAEAKLLMTPDKFPTPKKELEALCLD